MKVREEWGRGPWLRNPDAAAFQKRLEERRAELPEGAGPVLVAKAEPIDFLATFFAALLANRPVVLGNQNWGRKEWKQVKEMPLGTAGSGEILIPTGGSGGSLRFARHSWETLSESALGFSNFFGGGKIDSFCVLPLFHVSGLMQVVRALVTGGSVAFPGWNDLVAGRYSQSQGGMLSLVPTQLRRLVEVESLHGWLRNLDAILLGGAAVPEDLLEAAAGLALPVVLSYGATETAAMAAAQPAKDFLSGERTCGRPFSHVRLRIAGADGETLASGEVGEIRFAGSSLFTGYVPGGERTALEWRSGDLGFLDPRGRLVVVGREDRVVNTGGEKVSPEEVERVLLKSGLIRDVWVTAVEDREWGQVVAAMFTASGKQVSHERLRTLVRAELAAYKTPKIWLEVDEIPRTVQGKVDRRKVEEWLRKAHPIPET